MTKECAMWVYGVIITQTLLTAASIKALKRSMPGVFRRQEKAHVARKKNE